MTKTPPEGSRTLRVLGVLTTVGDVLALQLCFFVTSLAVVTMVPAAIALQRGLEDILEDGAPTRVSTFLRELLRGLRRYPAVSVVLPCLAAMALVGLLFWATTVAPYGIIGLAVLVPLAGLGSAMYFGALVETLDEPKPLNSRDLIRRGLARVRRQPLGHAGCVVAAITWLLLLVQVPTLVLVGSGVVPALLVHLLRRSDRRRSGDSPMVGERASG